jgi:hypothetical protein
MQIRPCRPGIHDFWQSRGLLGFGFNGIMLNALDLCLSFIMTLHWARTARQGLRSPKAPRPDFINVDLEIATLEFCTSNPCKLLILQLIAIVALQGMWRRNASSRSFRTYPAAVSRWLAPFIRLPPKVSASWQPDGSYEPICLVLSWVGHGRSSILVVPGSLRWSPAPRQAFPKDPLKVRQENLQGLRFFAGKPRQLQYLRVLLGPRTFRQVGDSNKRASYPPPGR